MRYAASLFLDHVYRHSLGLKAPRGWGWLTDPKRAAYNRVYNRTTTGCMVVVVPVGVGVIGWVLSN